MAGSGADAGRAKVEGEDLSIELARTFNQVGFDDLGPRVVEATKVALFDQMGVSIAGSPAPGCQDVVQQVVHWGGPAEATILPTGEKAPAVWAAFANATMARALDFDDVYEKAICHTTVATVPVALAMTEKVGATGKDILTSVALGREVVSRLTLANRNIHGEHVRSESYNNSAFAGAFIAGKLLGLEPEQLVDAMGLTYGLSLSNRQGVAEGKHSVRIHQGFSAQVAVQAAELAALGITGASRVLEGRYGYYPVYADGHWDRDAALDGFGKEFVGPDASVKLYPSCKQGHAAIDAAKRIFTNEAYSPDAVARVDVGLNEHGYYTICTPPENRWNPKTAMDGQFSAPWQVATALTKGSFFIEDLEPSSYGNPVTRKILDVLHCAIDPEIDAESKGVISSGVVTVTLKNGETIREHVRFAKGSPGDPLDLDGILDKFNRCLDFSVLPYSDAHRSELIDAVKNLDRIDSAREFMELFVARR